MSSPPGAATARRWPPAPRNKTPGPPPGPLPGAAPVVVGLGLLEEPVGVAAEQLLCCLRLQALPRQDVVDRVGKLALRVRIVGGIHQNVVAEEVGDMVEHVLAFVVLDATEEPAARHVFAWFLLERCGAADIDGLLVHAPGPER